MCGSAAGTASALAGAYYAGPGNRFWGMLYRTGLTPAPLRPAEFRSVVDHGIGLTDIVKNAFGADIQLRAGDFDREALLARIEAFQPFWPLTESAPRARFLAGPSIMVANSARISA